MNIMEQLQAPFPAEEIDWRVQSCGITNDRPWAIVLAYVQARAIQRRLDEVFGWDGWTDEYRTQDNNMICRLGVKTDNGWIYKENGASETQVEAFKGGISAAFKRVAASGYGIGRYLYDLTENFAICQLEKPKNMQGWNKAQTKDKKTIYWQTPPLPDWALPKGNIENIPTLDEVVEQWKDKGGTDKQFDELILNNFQVKDRKNLKNSHLVGIKKILDNKQKKGA